MLVPQSRVNFRKITEGGFCSRQRKLQLAVALSEASWEAELYYPMLFSFLAVGGRDLFEKCSIAVDIRNINLA